MDEALEQEDIVEAGGLAVGCILLVVLLFGVMNVTSLCALAEAVGQDAALCAVLGIQALEQKVLYRMLAAITVTQYQAWMSQVVRTLQQDPRTASLPSGGDCWRRDPGQQAVWHQDAGYQSHLSAQ